jgi:hypothetical protein
MVKAVISVNLDGESLIVHVDIANPDVWQKGRLGRFLEAVSEKIPVIVICGDQRHMRVPKKLIDGGVVFREEQMDGSVVQWSWVDGKATKMSG